MLWLSNNEAVCFEVQTHFGRPTLAWLTEKVLGAFPQFMCPKTKVLAIKFRHILEVLR